MDARVYTISFPGSLILPPPGANEVGVYRGMQGYTGAIQVSPFGNFNLARQELKKVALKALYKLRKEMETTSEKKSYLMH